MKMDLSLLPESVRAIRERVYFLGIGGSGMYGVARLAREMGLDICGSDASEGKNTARLRECGISLFKEDENLPSDISAIVYSLAVEEHHPRLCEARARGLTLFTRAEFLGGLMQAFPIRAAVSGSHGKSSTTAMCAEILRTAGVSPTVVSGADLDSEGSFRRGDGDVLLFEACEYRDAFLSFCPTHALALGVSWEHPDYFPDKASVTRSFHAFLHGKTVTCSVAPAMSELSADITFGHGGSVTAEAVTRAEEGHRFLLCRAGMAVGRVSLHVSGDFQIENALGAAALCHSLGIRDEDVVKGLSSYRGIPRRMEKCGTLRGVPLYLDFAHHPKELFCAMRTARGFGRPVAAVFEPHTYSRTKAFFEEYARVLRMPHMAGVLPIYAARERDDRSISSQMLAREAGIAFLADYVHAARFLTRAAGKGCTLLLAGAGSIEGVLAHLPFLFPQGRFKG